MKKLLNFIGGFLMLQSLILGVTLNENTRDLQEKVALCFVLFLIGIFILMKNKYKEPRYIIKYRKKK